MRLNLACGRTHFPTRRGAAIVEHLKPYLPDSAYDADDWVNADVKPLPGVDQAVDLFCYPWPWPDNSITEIWCSHLVEHIPHDARLRPGVHHNGLATAAAIDGFYAFFHEAWRVLEPGGVIHVLTPYGFSFQGLSDPQHRRYMTPTTFGYLAPQRSDAPFDYGLPFEFAATGEAIMRTVNLHDLKHGDMQYMMDHEINRADEMFISLKAVKP